MTYEILEREGSTTDKSRLVWYQPRIWRTRDPLHKYWVGCNKIQFGTELITEQIMMAYSSVLDHYGIIYAD